MAGKSDIVEQALKLIRGVGEDAAKTGIRAYHGTPEKGLTRLSTKHAVETPNAVFAAQNPDVAHTFTVPREYGEPVYVDEFGNDIEPGEVFELNLRPQNPFFIPSEAAQKFIDDTAVQTKMVKEAREKGHDLVIAPNVMEGIGERSPGDVYAILDDRIISIIRKYGIAGASAMLGYNLMENLSPEQAKAATEADNHYKSSGTYTGGMLPPGMEPSGELTSRTPSASERMYDYVFSKIGGEEDTKPQRAETIMNLIDQTPLGWGPVSYDIGRAGAEAITRADGGAVDDDEDIFDALRLAGETVSTGINRYVNPIRRLLGVETGELPEGVKEVDYGDLYRQARDADYGDLYRRAMEAIDNAALYLGGADPSAKRPMKNPVSPSGKIVDRVPQEDADIDGALRIAKDVGGSTPVLMEDAKGNKYDAQGNIIPPVAPGPNPARSNVTPEAVAAKAVNDPATFDALMERYAVPDRDIAEYEAIKKAVSQQPYETQQMTHVGAKPRREVSVDMPLFGGKYKMGTAPYDVAGPMSGMAQAAYDLKTAPLYLFPPTAGAALAADTTEGVMTGDPTSASLALLFGPGGKYARAAGIGAANYFLSPDQAEAGKSNIVERALQAISGMGEDAAKTGIRAYQGSPHNFAAERLVRFPEGRTEYIVGQPDVLPDVPQGAEVLQDFPLGRMRMDKIGTGEGAQAYGHGLYTAENEGVARWYRDVLSVKQNLGVPSTRQINSQQGAKEIAAIKDANNVFGRVFSAYSNSKKPKTFRSFYDFYHFKNEVPALDAEYQKQFGKSINEQINKVKSVLANQGKTELEINATLKYLGFLDALTPHKKAYDEALAEIAKHSQGRMYEVEISADPNAFLDWDKPLSEQPEAIKKLLPSIEEAKALDAQMDKLSADVLANPNDKALQLAWDEAYRNPRQKMARIVLNDANPKLGGKFSSGNQIYSALASKPSEASNFLSEAGIPGIKFLDAGSRSVGEGTHNYVIFDDKLISIIRKYGIAGASAMLGYNLMEQLDPKQALAATMADQDYKNKIGSEAQGGRVTAGNAYDNTKTVDRALALTREF